MNPPLSLKGRALQLLAQREHSRLELRRKLLRRLRDDRRRDGAAQAAQASTAASDPAPSVDPLDLAAEVDAVLDWLHAHRYLSDERFVESRVHARSARYGNLRIRQELSQHGLALTPVLSGELRDSERARAVEVQQRKFGGPPASLHERARQARFLSGRGFSPDVVRRVLRAAGQRDTDHAIAHDDDGSAPAEVSDDVD